MSTEPIRDLDQLNPEFRRKLELFLKAMKSVSPMAPHETFRTEERQAMLVQTGASKIYHSNHQDGVAADLHFTTGDPFPSGSEKWKEVAEIAKDFGIDCGGLLWNGWDWNHFQDSGLPDQALKGLAEWQIEARQWAMINNVSNGERPLENITRVEVMEMFRKFAGKFNL